MEISHSENSDVLPKTLKWQYGLDWSFSIEDIVGRQPIDGANHYLSKVLPQAWKVSIILLKLYIWHLLMRIRFRASPPSVFKLSKYVKMTSVVLVSLNIWAINSSKNWTLFYAWALCKQLKGKWRKSSNLGGLKVGKDVLEAGLNLVDLDMSFKKLLPLASERNIKAKIKWG